MPSITHSLHFFCSEGTLIDTTLAPRILLEGGEYLWFLESGKIELFSVEKKPDNEFGPLHYMSTLNAPITLFPFPTEGKENSYAVLGVTHSTTRLWQVPLQALKKELETNLDLRFELITCTQEWLLKLSNLFRVKSVVDNPKILLPQTTMNLKAGEVLVAERIVRPEEKETVLWMQVLKGKILIYGEEAAELPLHMIYPLNQNIWLKVASPATVKTVTEEEISHEEAWSEILFQFHALILRYIQLNQKIFEQRELDRLALKKERDAQILDNAFRHISGAFSTRSINAIEDSDHPLVKTCQILTRFMGMSLTPPDKTLEGNIITQLTSISGTQFRYRQVLLDGRWWQRDCGPLLGLYGPDKTPVALINKKPTKYEMQFPFSNESILVTPEIAGNLFPEAYSFYIPLPLEVNTGPKILSYYLRRNNKEVLNIILMGIAGAVLGLFPPIATQQLVDRVIPSNDLSLLTEVFLGLFLISLNIGIFFLIKAYGILRLEGISSSQLQSALWDRLLSLPTSFFRQYSVGDLITRVNASEQIRTLLSGNASSVVLSGFFSLLYLLMMLFFSPGLLAVVLAVTVVYVVIFAIYLMKSKRLQEQVFNLQGACNGAVLQIIRGVAKLRISGAENRAFSYWSRLFLDSKIKEYNSQRMTNVIGVTNSILPALYVLVIFAAFLVFFEMGGSPFPGISLGNFLGFFAAFGAFSITLFDVTNTLISFIPIFPLWKRAKPILEAETEVKTQKNPFGTLIGKVALEKVSFRYDASSALILKDVSINVNPGEFIGIVGYSGCGKSTLIRLLLGFEKPETGAIYYDGKDMTGVNIHELRRQLGIVLQDDSILSGTIRDNITCGRICTKEQIDHALEVSGFAKDMESFPMGLHTMFSSGGETISGGQRQRLFIARALIANPKILIFDEATSALDNKAQDDVSKNIEKLNVTRIVIAHRLSTIRNADRIYVMEKGHVTDTGTFEELSQKPGLFADILRRQKL